MALLVVEDKSLIDTRNVAFIDLMLDSTKDIGSIVAAFPIRGKDVPDLRGGNILTFKDVPLFVGSVAESKSIFHNIKASWFKEVSISISTSTKILPTPLEAPRL